jgi:uncharacterized membrane protein YeaQ/YmgE (transglycosylase-associated protein family)
MAQDGPSVQSLLNVCRYMSIIHHEGFSGIGRSLEIMIMREFLRICLVGFVVGLLARFLVPGDDSMGIIGSVLLGFGGSVVGGAVPRLFNSDRARGPFSPAGFGGSILGAILLIVVGRVLF